MEQEACAIPHSTRDVGWRFYPQVGRTLRLEYLALLLFAMVGSNGRFWKEIRRSREKIIPNGVVRGRPKRRATVCQQHGAHLFLRHCRNLRSTEGKALKVCLLVGDTKKLRGFVHKIVIRSSVEVPSTRARVRVCVCVHRVNSHGGGLSFQHIVDLPTSAWTSAKEVTEPGFR